MQADDSTRCPSCGQQGVSAFYEARRVPVHSVLLMSTPEEAVGYPRGDIVLAFCPSCGFIFNQVFDPTLHEYSTKYEETQGFSPTFAAFHRQLAESLIEKFQLRGKRIIEIGCGKGEFLAMLCELGGNSGVGFDPAYVSERNTSTARDRLTFVNDLYSEKYTDVQGDFVCCKMTLEHIPDVYHFLSTVRRSIADRTDTVVFFQIPEMRRILQERAFWDVYYEHCSYFTKGSLARAFRRAGFDVLRLWTDYDDQYLMIEARPRTAAPSAPLPEEDDVLDVAREKNLFVQDVERFLREWRHRLDTIRGEGRRAVIWGGGSKGVAFLTKLGVTDEIQAAVDVNPYKENTFMAGTGHRIVLPASLRDLRPDDVIVMNPIYMKEIQESLSSLGLSPTVHSVTTV